MKLSVMSYTISRQLKPGQDVDIAAMCRLAQELDLEAIDIMDYGLSAEDVRKTLDDHGIKAACFTFGADINHAEMEARKPGVETIREGLKAAQILGAENIMVVPSPKEGVDRNVSRANFIERFREAAAYAIDAGINMSLENFSGWNSPFVTADDFLEALAEVPSLKLTYDNGNAFTGEEPAQSFTRCAEHVVFAHFKDWVETNEDEGRKALNGNYYKPALIGEGIIDHKSCLAAMKKGGYKGYINIEYEGNDYSAEDATRKICAYLRKLIAEVESEQ